MILNELMSFEILRVVWWVLLGLLLIGFAVMDGFDFGIGCMLPFVAKTDIERRIVINTIGPVWEGNQVWFVLGGGAIFAAWPILYAVSFSGFYLAMFLLLASMIVRPMAFKYRSKRDGKKWRRNWDALLFIAGLVPALVFGVAVGNAIQGVPFHLTPELRSFYTGSFWGLFNPFALLAGILSLAMMVMHGASYLMLKTEGPIAKRARVYGGWAALLTIASFAGAGIWLAYGIEAYRFVGEAAPNGPSNPLFSEVIRQGSWLDAYTMQPWKAVAPLLGISGAALAWMGLRLEREKITILFSGVSIASIIATVGLSMFPFILPSSTDPNSSLTVWDSSSSQLTLFVMLGATAIFLPMIVAYTSWVYKVLWGKVTEDDLTSNPGAY